MNLSETLIEEERERWDRMLSHSFLTELRDGELDDETFHQWLRQDYEFVRAALPFVSVLKSKAPDEHLRGLTEAEMALHDELDLFRERAKSVGVSVDNVPRNLTTQSYIQHLIATGFREDYPTALTVYWAAEKAYHESWKVVEPGIPQGHPWHPFVHNWASEEFAEFVQFLESSLNSLAKKVSDDVIRSMKQQFRWTVRYEIAFWDMAHGRSGSEWIKSGAR